MYGPLHLNDAINESCRGVEHSDYYRYTIAPNILDCGTTIEVSFLLQFYYFLMFTKLAYKTSLIRIRSFFIMGT